MDVNFSNAGLLIESLKERVNNRGWTSILSTLQDKKTECPVCYTSFGSSTTVACLVCRKHFHLNCAALWYKSCPMCRASNQHNESKKVEDTCFILYMILQNYVKSHKRDISLQAIINIVEQSLAEINLQSKGALSIIEITTYSSKTSYNLLNGWFASPQFPFDCPGNVLARLGNRLLNFVE